MPMPTPDDDDVDSTHYPSIFSEHFDDFRAHLAGRDYDDDPPPASKLPPRAFWTSAEQDVFFHALAVHSRLRPDLIAEEVKTKTIPDICVYLALLEEADHELSQAVAYAGGRNRYSQVKLSRQDLPTAIEVSDEWITYEERAADALVAAEIAHEPETVLQEREEEVNSRRSLIRASRGGARTASNERDRDGERERRKAFEEWLAQREEDWKGEDLLLSLDKVGLTTLDRILRDDEEGRGLMFDTHNGEFKATPIDGNGPPDNQEHADGIREDLIDPVLLELSQASALVTATPDPVTAHETGEHATHNAVQSSATSFQPNTPPFTPTLLPPFEQRSPAGCIAPSVAPSGSTEDGGDVSQMSPASRRRYQKRLYMRRKRAKATGEAINENAERLKPGRKPKKRPEKAESSTSTPAPSTPAPEAVREQTATPLESVGTTLCDETSAYRHPKVSGLTQPYKRQVQFLSKGVDAQRLRREGLDLFHLQTISKLMQYVPLTPDLLN